MKKPKELLCVALILAVALLGGCATGGTASAGITYDKDPKILTDEEKKTIGAHPEDMELITQDGTLSFFMNTLTAEFYIEDTASGARWFSNPTDWNNDEIASSAVKEQLGSQLIVEYYDEKNVKGTLASYDDAFLKGQIDVQKISNGVRVEYLIGTLKVREYCPQIVRAEIFEQLLDSLPADEAKTLSKRYRRVVVANQSEKTMKEFLETYPKLKEFEEVYIIRDLGLPVKKEIGEQFAQFGWTTEDIDAEHQRFGYVNTEASTGCFLIPVEYRLENGSFVAEILSEQIQSQKGYYLSKIDLLPYFAAANQAETGYMLLPDGSGALLDLNASTKNGYAYSQPIYGEDLALTQTIRETIMSPVYLPVFGMKTGRGAVLGMVEGAAAAGMVNATLSGELSSYNAVWSSFSPLAMDYLTYDATMDEKGKYVFAKAAVQERFRVRYSFLAGENADYTAMALRYREHLMADRTPLAADQATAGFTLELVGGVDKRETLLGIPYTTYAALTSFSQAQDILQKLLDGGVQQMQVRFTGWTDGGLNNRLSNAASPLSVLGGKKGLRELIDFTGQHQVSLYMDAEMAFVYSEGMFDGFSRNRDVARLITRKIATRQPALKSSGKLLEDRIGYVLSAQALDRVMGAFLEDYASFDNPYVSFASLGTALAGDYRESQVIDRAQAASLLQKALEKQVAGKYQLLVDGANALVLSQASGILHMPMTSSQLLMTSRSVPFYAIAVSGYLPYAGEAMNLSGDGQRALLQAAETGAGLYCQWMYADNDVLYDTNRSDLYALHYGTWIDDTIAVVTRYQEDMAGIAGRKILSHEQLAPDVYKTTFEGGGIVYVNYAGEDITVDGRTLAAQSYQAVRGEG